MFENLSTEELSDRLQAIAVAIEDKESAGIVDAASVRMIELVEENERLRAELQAREEAKL